MKKIMCALTVAAIAAPIGSAHALNLYEKDGLKFKMKGDWQIQLRQDPGKDQDLDVEYDDLEIKNSITYDLGNGLTAIGQVDLGFKNAADKSDSDEPGHLEEAYLGFGYKGVEFVFGKTTSASDEFGIEEAIEAPVAEDVFDEFGAVDGDDLLKLTAEFGDMFTVIVAHELNPESEKSSGNGHFTDIYAQFEYSGLTIAASYENFEESGTGAEDIDIYGLSISYDAKFAEFGADYSESDDLELSFYNISVGIPLDSFKICGGYQKLNYDNAADEDVAGWYANVTYKFPAAKNVSVFAEIADTDEDGADMGYLVGARIKF